MGTFKFGKYTLGYNSQSRLHIFTQQVINVTSVFPLSTLFDLLLRASSFLFSPVRISGGVAVL